MTLNYVTPEWVKEHCVEKVALQASPTSTVVTCFKVKKTGLAVYAIDGYAFHQPVLYGDAMQDANINIARAALTRDLSQRGMKPRMSQAQIDAVVKRVERNIAGNSGRLQLTDLLMEGEELTHVCIGRWAGGDAKAGQGQFEPMPIMPESYVGLVQDWSGAVGGDSFAVGEGSPLGTPLTRPVFAWTKRRVFFVVVSQDGSSRWAWVPREYMSDDVYFIGA